MKGLYLPNYIEPKASERKFQALARIGKELGIPVPEVFLSMAVIMPDGKKIHEHSQRSHSYNRNFYNFAFCQLDAKDPSDNTFGAGKLSLKGTNGNVNYGNYGLNYTYYFSSALKENNIDAVQSTNLDGLLAGAGITSIGVVVGTGVNAESFEDYALQTLIANGNGAGQMSYSASELHSVNYDAPSKTLTDTLIRYINNNSGGDIGVNEVGLIFGVGLSSSPFYVMMSHDHLVATVTIPNTGQLKVTYTVSLTYPA